MPLEDLALNVPTERRRLGRRRDCCIDPYKALSVRQLLWGRRPAELHPRISRICDGNTRTSTFQVEQEGRAAPIEDALRSAERFLIQPDGQKKLKRPFGRRDSVRSARLTADPSQACRDSREVSDSRAVF